ncbi:unnamed protein product [Tilletia caries]|nr:unnamed protein product [Tilletia caries]
MSSSTQQQDTSTPSQRSQGGDAPLSPPASASAPAPAAELASQPDQHDSELTNISLDEDQDQVPEPEPPAQAQASQQLRSEPAPSIELSRPSLPPNTSTPATPGTGTAGSPTGTHTPYEVFADRSTADASQILDDSTPVILGIAVVDFNHLVGPQIEFAHPNSLLDDPDLASNLPFLALPDGSHLIASDALLRKGAEVTRSTVQKAVVVLAREPVFGPIREKLGIVTRAFFAQGDLADINILIDFHATLEAGLQSGGFSSDREAALHMGTSLREFIYKWRSKTLVLVKMLLLQRNIMFYGYPIEQLCTQQYSLVSLIPGLLASLQDAGLPKLDTRTSTRAKAESLRTSDRKSLLRFLGLPLNLFARDAFFQPYLPLQQIDLLKGATYLVGTSNSIYRQQKDCAIDVIVDLEHSTLEFVNPHAQKLSALTAPDRKWMAELEQLVLSTWNPADPTRPAGMQYEGSDDHLRARFEEYICALLSSVKYYQFEQGQGLGQGAGKGDAALAGTSFMRTKAFPSWNDSTDPMIFDLIDHRHPCDGKTSAIEDVGLRLAAGLQDMHLEENLAAPARLAIGSAIQVGGAGLYRFASGLRSEVVKLREARLGAGVAGNEDGAGAGAGGSRPVSGTLSAGSAGATNDKRASVSSVASSNANKELPASPAATTPLSPGSFMSSFRIPGTPSTSASSSSHTNAGVEGVSSSASPSSPSAGAGAGAGATANQIADVAAQTADRAAQAAAQAGTQVRAAFGNFGSFLAKQQRQWAAPSPSSPSSASTTTTAAGGNGSASRPASIATSLKSSTANAGTTAAAAAAGLGNWASSLVAGSTSTTAPSLQQERRSSTWSYAPSVAKEKESLPSLPAQGQAQGVPAATHKDVPDLPLPPAPPVPLPLTSADGKVPQEEEEEQVYVVADDSDTVSRESVAEVTPSTSTSTSSITYPPTSSVPAP